MTRGVLSYGTLRDADARTSRRGVDCRTDRRTTRVSPRPGRGGRERWCRGADASPCPGGERRAARRGRHNDRSRRRRTAALVSTPTAAIALRRRQRVAAGRRGRDRCGHRARHAGRRGHALLATGNRPLAECPSTGWRACAGPRGRAGDHARPGAAPDDSGRGGASRLAARRARVRRSHHRSALPHARATGAGIAHCRPGRYPARAARPLRRRGTGAPVVGLRHACSHHCERVADSRVAPAHSPTRRRAGRARRRAAVCGDARRPRCAVR